MIEVIILFNRCQVFVIASSNNTVNTLLRTHIEPVDTIINNLNRPLKSGLEPTDTHSIWLHMNRVLSYQMYTSTVHSKL